MPLSLPCIMARGVNELQLGSTELMLNKSVSFPDLEVGDLY